MRFPDTLLLAALHGAVLSAAATAQVPDGGPTPAARLEQLDNTYSSNLRKYHAPIIQDYLASLEKLRQAMAQRNRADDSAAVQAEIDRVKSISAGSGLLPYDVLKPESETGMASSPKPPAGPPLRKTAPAGAIILAASAAKKSSPDPATLAERPDGRAVPVGSAEWRVEKIPAGDYRVLILYSCAGRPADSTIVARLGLGRVQRTLTDADATGGVNEFRISRLGLLKVEKDVIDKTLTLQNSDPASAAIWVRQIIISRAMGNESK